MKGKWWRVKGGGENGGVVNVFGRAIYREKNGGVANNGVKNSSVANGGGANR